MANVDQTLDAIIAQFNKAKGEIVGKITELSDLIANGGGNLSPATQAKLDTLVTMAQAFDDIVPDAPVATPPDQNLPPVETPPVTTDPVTTPPADGAPVI